MNQIVKYPILDPDETFGRHLIFPLDSFTAKGYWWRDSIRFEIETFAFPMETGKTVVMYRWGNPTREKTRGSKVTTSRGGIDTGKTCMCSDCVAGRKEVDAGWTPWGPKGSGGSTR